MYLGDEIQKVLRSMQKIGNDEVLLKEGDIFVALNVISKQRRIINIDNTLLEILSNNYKNENKRILKG